MKVKINRNKKRKVGLAELYAVLSYFFKNDEIVKMKAAQKKQQERDGNK